MAENQEIDMMAVVKKLVGPIHPHGSTHIDEKRLANLKVMVGLADAILNEIGEVAQCHDSSYHSMKECGQVAHKFLVSLRKELQEDRL